MMLVTASFSQLAAFVKFRIGRIVGLLQSSMIVVIETKRFGSVPGKEMG